MTWKSRVIQPNDRYDLSFSDRQSLRGNMACWIDKERHFSLKIGQVGKIYPFFFFGGGGYFESKRVFLG